MDAVLVVCRLVLALVFIVSGVAKLLDRDDARQAMRNFGMPGPLARVGGIGLPLAELLIAALLLPQRTAWLGATGALLLLLMFIAAISYQLARGRRPECHCFGALDAGPIGARTLVRNAVLSLLALAVAITGWRDAWTALVDASSTTVLILVLGVCLFLLMALQATLTLILGWRISARLGELTAEASGAKARAIRRRAGELVPVAVGEPAPTLELPALTGDLVDFASLKGRESLLVFVRPGCWACHALLPTLLEWDTSLTESDPRLIVISRGAADENRDLAGMKSPVLLSSNTTVSQAFGIGATPAALLLDRDGVVSSEVYIGIGAVSSLLKLARDGSTAGQPSRESSGRWRQSLASWSHQFIAALRGTST
jgi:uncharacterized membrane protein YphA (DoxX/SURF4 family)/peroxiredoxin